jgi:NADPH:quinone reductase-like Zn-dependent oxidoreductase
MARPACQSANRALGLTDWYRDGPLAKYVAVEARNLAPLPGKVVFSVGASVVVSGMTAWQVLFEHSRASLTSTRKSPRN